MPSRARGCKPVTAQPDADFAVTPLGGRLDEVAARNRSPEVDREGHEVLGGRQGGIERAEGERRDKGHRLLVCDAAHERGATGQKGVWGHHFLDPRPEHCARE